jgi:hypothetical protein
MFSVEPFRVIMNYRQEQERDIAIEITIKHFKLLNGNLNSKVPNRSVKEWYENNKEKIKIYNEKRTIK